MRPLLTVIIPVYNQEKMVLEAIKSVPERNDIEILVIDDGSTDNTLEVLRQYQMTSSRNMVVLYNEENKGVGFTVNKGYDYASGEYVVLLGSDDQLLPDFNKVVEELDGTDIVYFDLITNDKTILHLDEYSKWGLCGSVKCIKKEFIGETRCPEVRAGEDWFFFRELMKKEPRTEKYTGIVGKHYNYPRPGSLHDKHKRGEI